MSIKCYIDAGHNHSGWDTGAAGFGLREQDINFYVALALSKKLTAVGIETNLSRASLESNLGNNLSTSLSARTTAANNWKADYFISIHCNASENASAVGTEVLIHPNSKIQNLAKTVQAAIVKNMGTADRAVKTRGDLHVLNATNMPAILIELAFISNPNDNTLLKDKQDEFASAILHGLCEGLNLKVEPKAELQELTDIGAIVWEYAHRGIVTDANGMTDELNQNPNGRLY